MQIFQKNLQSLVHFFPTLIYAFLIFSIFVGLGYIIAMGVQKILRTSKFPQTYESFFLKIVRWAFGILGFLVALKILGFGNIAASLLAGGGVTAIVLGFAFRDIGENILAGFFLAFSRPFSIGDLIKSEGLEGRVKNVELRHTHIRTSDGCDIFIPSGQIFTKPLFNYTRDGLRKANFVIGIDYNDDTSKALKLLQHTIEANSKIINDPPPKVKIAEFTANYVELNVSFWINTFKQEKILAALKTEVMEACKTDLLKNGFTLSSNVTTALEMKRLNVHLEEQKE